MHGYALGRIHTRGPAVVRAFESSCTATGQIADSVRGGLTVDWPLRTAISASSGRIGKRVAGQRAPPFVMRARGAYRVTFAAGQCHDVRALPILRGGAGPTSGRQYARLVRVCRVLAAGFSDLRAPG